MSTAKSPQPVVKGVSKEAPTKLRTDTTTVQSTAKGRTQGGRMRTQILRVDATGGVKKGRKA